VNSGRRPLCLLLLACAALLGAAIPSEVDAGPRAHRSRALTAAAPASRPVSLAPRSIGGGRLATALRRPAQAARRGIARLGAATRGTRPQLDASQASRDHARQLRARFADRDAVLADQAADPHVAEVTAHSARDGRYLILSDLHMGPGKRGGRWSQSEDFRRDATFVSFVEEAAADPRPTTLLFNGDWLEIARHVDADASVEQVAGVVRRTVKGHEREFRALAQAVVRGGVRVLYTVGNHDVQLVDRRVRDAFVDEIVRVAGLDARGAATLRGRMAWSGPLALLGAAGEVAVGHGHAHDATNNFPSIVNPYSGDRVPLSNLGWEVVRNLVRPATLFSTDGRALSENEKLGAVIDHLKRTVSSRSILGRLLRSLFVPTVDSPGERLAERLDHRAAVRAWVRRTGVAERTPIASGGPTPELAWVRAVEGALARAPEPIFDRLRSPSFAVNVVRAVYGVLDAYLSAGKHDAAMLDGLGELPGVRVAVWGHNHREGALERPHPTKGTLQHINSGTWTKTPHGWRLNVVEVRVDAGGRADQVSLNRTESDGTLRSVDLASTMGPGRSLLRRAIAFARHQH
jgi:UDP-2,3-diacylglucosamine pyrophosphatase LpxH